MLSYTENIETHTDAFNRQVRNPMQALQTSVITNNVFDMSAVHAAALVDENGREIPITEEMILSACDELMKLWHFPNAA